MKVYKYFINNYILTNMSINDFLSSKNINLLWEVIKEEDEIKVCSTELVNHFKLFIQSTLHDFFEKEKSNIKQLKDMNKKYIIFIIQYIRIYLKNKIPNNKLSYVKDEISTFEDLNKERKGIFAEIMDEPIQESNKLMDKIVKQRLMEEEIFKNSSDIQNIDNNWIKPVETSIQKEKIQNMSTELKNQNQSNFIKYIKIEKEMNFPINEVIDLETSFKSDTNSNTNDLKNIFLKKHISWKEDINNENNVEIYENTQDANIKTNIITSSDLNIFSKLKKIDKNIEVENVKEEMKMMHTKIEELDKTINNILVWIKENKK
jgi:hypothetical protein